MSCTLETSNKTYTIASEISSAPDAIDSSPLHPSLFSRNQCHFLVLGHIDNKGDLCKKLGINRNEQRTISYSELLSRLFEVYGESTPTKLYGNWLYVIFDNQRKALWLAQNQHEYAALYYHESKDHFSFSTSQHALLSLDHVPRRLDLLKIVRRDAIISNTSVDETFFQGIRLLNPAHWIRVTREASHRERYWHPEEILTNYQINRVEAEEQLLLLFKEAVNRRSKYGKSVASMLSGGLDSGSVVAVTAEQLREQNRALHTYSHIPHFDLQGLNINHRTGNEQPLMQATASLHPNIVTHYLDSASFSPLQGIREINHILLEPIHAACNAYWLIDLVAQAAANKHDVLLSGEMGNATISYTGYTQGLSTLDTLKYSGIQQLIKQRILKPPYQLTKRALNLIKQQGDAWQAYSYLHPKLANSLDIETMIRKSGRTVDFSATNIINHQQQMQRILMPGFNPRLRNMFALGHHFGLELRDPTGDIKLIEFILSLPNQFFFGPNGESKWMLKQMMRNRLPKEVLFQKSKGLQSADIAKRVQPDIKEIESIIRDFNSHLHDEPLFDKKRMLNDLYKLKKGDGNHMMTHHLLRTVGNMEYLNVFE